MRVVHVINDLDRGGAETILLRLLSRIPSDISSRVISLTSKGSLGTAIEELDVPVESIGVNSAMGYMTRWPRLCARINDCDPDVVQTWMYHADMLGGLASRVRGHHRIAWGLHATVRPPGERGVLYQRGLGIAARLSHRVPTLIVCCSVEAARSHEAVGYDPRKLLVIPNGFEAFDLPDDARSSLLQHIDASRDAFIVSSIGRFHRDKDQPTLIAAARLIVERVRNVHFVLVGDGLDGHNGLLNRLIRESGLQRNVHLLGPTDRIEGIYGGSDLVVCSSVAEALPLSLGEAMASGVPVVTTDVGDARLLVDDQDRVVPKRSPEALARAILYVLTMSTEDRRKLGVRDRESVNENYGLGRMVDAYADLYRSIGR